MTEEEMIKTELNDFLVKHHMSKTDLREYLQSEVRYEYESRMKEQIRKNDGLVGRYFMCKTNTSHSVFPEMFRYYKVVSSRAENEYRVTCLVFDEHPTYWFNYQMHKMQHPGDWFLGSFEFSSFELKDVMANEIRSMMEITSEDFALAAKKYLDELLDLTFHAEHYRSGGKLPSDVDWPSSRSSI